MENIEVLILGVCLEIFFFFRKKWSKIRVRIIIIIQLYMGKYGIPAGQATFLACFPTGLLSTRQVTFQSSAKGKLEFRFFSSPGSCPGSNHNNKIIIIIIIIIIKIVLHKQNFDILEKWSHRKVSLD